MTVHPPKIHPRCQTRTFCAESGRGCQLLPIPHARARSLATPPPKPQSPPRPKAKPKPKTKAKKKAACNITLSYSFFGIYRFTDVNPPPPPNNRAGCLLVGTIFFGPGGCPFIRALFAFSHSTLIGTIFWGLGGVPTYLGTAHVKGTARLLGGGTLYFACVKLCKILRCEIGVPCMQNYFHPG